MSPWAPPCRQVKASFPIPLRDALPEGQLCKAALLTEISSKSIGVCFRVKVQVP